MPSYQDLTDPTHTALSPSRHKAQAKTSAAIAEKEARYLQYWCESSGDIMAALHAAGYAPTSPDNARSMDYQIRERIDRECDARTVLMAAGLGLTRFAQVIMRLISQDDIKYVAVGAKLLGVPLGAFSQAVSNAGAQITVQVLQTQGSQPTQTGMVRVEVDARKPLTP